MAPAAAATPVYVLGNDLLHEVFLRLPTPADLLRTALACKPFLGAARNAAFLRQFRRLNPSTCPLLLGCLLRPEDHLPLLLSEEAADETRRVAETGDFALSFLPGGGAPWQVLDCRNGRLLARNLASGELVVADPLSRRWVSLPAPPTERPVGYGLVAGDVNSSVFHAVCISRDAGSGSSEMRASVLSSSEFRWADVAGLASQPNLAGSRAMHSHRSLYWKLEGGERMVALNTATTEFSLVDLPKELHKLSFDVFEKEEDGGLYLLTMRAWSIEVWAAVEDGTGGLIWRLVDTSVRFNRAMEEMHGSPWSYRDGLDVIGVAAGFVFLRHGALLFSIDLETMRPERLSLKEDCPSALIYPYTTAWPPLFLSRTEQGASQGRRC